MFLRIISYEYSHTTVTFQSLETITLKALKSDFIIISNPYHSILLDIRILVHWNDSTLVTRNPNIFIYVLIHLY